MFDKWVGSFGTHIYEVGDVASNVPSGFGRETKYLKHERSQLVLSTVQTFHGQDDISVSIRPNGERPAVQISASQLNVAQNIAVEMSRQLPE